MEVWQQFQKEAIYCEKVLLNSNFSENIILKAQKKFGKRFSAN